MRHVFSRHIPPLDEVLVVESGPREVAEKFLRHLYLVQQSRRVDLVTCLPSPPGAFDAQRGVCYSIHDAEYAGKRGALVRRLAKETQYSVLAMLCTGSPVMSKWKWAIATRTAAKTLIVNENADFFFLDWQHRHTAQRMISTRVGIGGDLHIGLLGEMALLPFTVAFLMLSTGWIQLRRLLRQV